MPRKATGTQVDILFKESNTELVVYEVGRNRAVITDSKYLDDDLIKLPKTSRDILSLLMQKGREQMNNSASIGFLVSKQKI